MFEVGEVLTLLVTIILFGYLVTLLKGQNRTIKTKWFYGIILIIFTQVCTVAEGLFWPVLFNYLEHFLFTVACLLFLISILKKEL